MPTKSKIKPEDAKVEKAYIQLAKVLNRLEEIQERINNIEESESISNAAFSAGQAYTLINKLCSETEEIVDEMYDESVDTANPFEHYTDIN